MRNRFNLKTEIYLALLPTFTMALVLLLLENYSKQHLLFASLASSAFLIYVAPGHPVNSIFTLTISQLSAAITGSLMLWLLGPGYISALCAMVVIIIIMITANILHPPAVSTALTFAFSTGKTLPLFLIAVAIIVILIILQRLSIWIITKHTSQKTSN